MATILDPASDSQCDLNSCGRKCGSSEKFKTRLNVGGSQKTLNTSIPRGQFKILEDMKHRFTKIDPNTNTNIFKKEYDIVDLMSTRLNKEYDDVFKAATNQFTIVPPTFQYGKDMTASIKGLQDRIDTEKNNAASSAYTSKEVEKMESILQNLKGEVAESQVHSKLEELWHGKQGVLFHSFHPETIFFQLIDRAKSQRQNTTTLDFTDLETELSDMLRIDLPDVKSEAKAIVNGIKINHAGVGNLTPQLLQVEVENQNTIKKKKRNVIKDMIKLISKATGKQTFTFDEAEKGIAMGILYDLFKPDGEMDFVGLLVEKKLIFNFEIKYQRANNTNPPTKLLDDATRQTSTNEEYITRVFAPLFNVGWRLIKVPVIIQQDTPGTLDPTTYCQHCSKYIITSKSLADMPSWFRQLFPQSNTTSPPCSTNPVLRTEEVEFLRFFEIITSSLCTTSHIRAWTRVVGANCQLPIAAGYTPIQAPPIIGKGQFVNATKKAKKLLSSFSQRLKISSSTIAQGATNTPNPDEISLEEALFKYHDAQKVLFFSKFQTALLDVSFSLNVILWGDYGTGKFF